MDLNQKLKETLETIGIPVEQDEYTGKEDKYILFLYEDEIPQLHGNNRVLSDTVYLQIQLITPKNFNYMEWKHRIRDSLEAEGFFVTSIRSFLGDVYAGIEKTRQTVFQVEYTQGRRN